METKPLPPSPAAKPMPPSPAESQRSSTNSIEPASPMVSGSRSVSGGSVAGDTPNSRAKPEALLPSPPPSDGTVQSSIVEALRVQVAQLQSRLRASEARVAMWEECMQHMCQSVMFSPDMNETYKDTCVSLLRDVSPPPHPIQLARAPRPPAAPSRARSRVLGATRALSLSLACAGALYRRSGDCGALRGLLLPVGALGGAAHPARAMGVDARLRVDPPLGSVVERAGCLRGLTLHHLLDDHAALRLPHVGAHEGAHGQRHQQRLHLLRPAAQAAPQDGVLGVVGLCASAAANVHRDCRPGEIARPPSAPLDPLVPPPPQPPNTCAPPTHPLIWAIISL